MKLFIDQIVISKDNPRQSFDEEGLRRLGESIKAHGQLQPIIVRKKGSFYELVVGERRLRASALVGLTEIEANVRDVDDATCLELRLIENTQREDLTDAEKGDAVLSLWANYDKYETLEDVARVIGFSPKTVEIWVYHSENISPKLRDMISTAVGITNRGVRALLKYPTQKQSKLADVIIKKQIPTMKVIEFTKLHDANPQRNLDEIADEVLGIETVTIAKEKLPPEVLEKIEDEKKQLAKVHRIHKKPSKPITKEDVKKKFAKKTSFKFEKVRVSHGVKGAEAPLKREIKPLAVPIPETPDYSQCKCAICPLYGSDCKGRCWT